IPMASGSIMAAVAVLLIHMDKKAVVIKIYKLDNPKCPLAKERIL
ncbi:hypothetical protein SAMN05421673_1231, partial [Campylobacter lari subsp. lari]